MSASTLYRFYAHHKIKYRAAKTIYNATCVHRGALDEARMEFAIFIGNAIKLTKPLVYMDESSFNTWSTKMQSWAGPH